MKPLLPVILVVTAFRSAVADWNDVPTGSMKPTILEGDRVFVNRLAYDLNVPYTTWHLLEWAEPQRGDIVVCYSPADGKRLVKRVVGLPGDRIELRNNRLIVNGAPAEYRPLEPWFQDQVSAAERSQHVFASEQLGHRPHPVMARPAAPVLRSFPETTIPPDSYFLMGDNRDNSFDSRFFGCVRRSQILGRATGVVLSMDPDQHLHPRWERFLTRLP